VHFAGLFFSSLLKVHGPKNKIATQKFKNFPTFYGTPKFMTVLLAKHLHWCLL